MPHCSRHCPVTVLCHTAVSTAQIPSYATLQSPQPSYRSMPHCSLHCPVTVLCHIAVSTAQIPSYATLQSPMASYRPMPHCSLLWPDTVLCHTAVSTAQLPSYATLQSPVTSYRPMSHCSLRRSCVKIPAMFGWDPSLKIRELAMGFFDTGYKMAISVENPMLNRPFISAMGKSCYDINAVSNGFPVSYHVN